MKTITARYVTDCGIIFTIVRDMGSRIESIEAFQRKDGKIVRALLVSVEVK